MKTKFSSQVSSYMELAKEEYVLYTTTFNISNLISYEKYRDKVAKLMNLETSDTDMLIIG